MAKFDTVWYVNYGNGTSTRHFAVAQWATGQAISVGALRRQLAAPSAGNERVFLAIVAGNTHATTEPTWTLTRGAKTTDNTVTWQEVTGMAAVNGDTTNTPLSSALRSLAIDLGVIVKNNAATHLFICTTAGTAGAGEPTYNTTTGATTTDSGVTWTCIGTISAFAAGAAPHARLSNALVVGWFVNGSKVFIGHDSAETRAAAYNITAGQIGTPLRVICHNAAGNYPPQSADVTTGATITTTGANAFDFAGAGQFYEGVTFQCGSGAVNSVISISNSLNGVIHFKNCSLQKLGTTAANNSIQIGAVVGLVIFENTTIKFGSTGDVLRFRHGDFQWRNTGQILASGSSVPTSLFSMNFTGGGIANVLCEGVDFSQISGTIVNNSSSNGNSSGRYVFKNCKLHASVTRASFATTNAGGWYCDFFNCNSGAVNYDSARYTMFGTQTIETTIIRTGGATQGGQGRSAKIVTTADASYDFPFEMQPIYIWNDATGSPLTVKVEGVWGGGAVPNDDEIWMDVEYLGSSAAPLSSWATEGKVNHQATAAAQGSSSETWGGSTTEFKLEKQITPQMAGWIAAHVRVARASSTFYVDPKIELAA